MTRPRRLHRRALIADDLDVDVSPRRPLQPFAHAITAARDAAGLGRRTQRPALSTEADVEHDLPDEAPPGWAES